MPLIKKPSKKAFEHNIKAEMHSGKPQDQALAIAYDVKRRNAKKKKMAEGGYINDSAKSEHRPMPEERDQDSKMVSRNSGDKPSKNDHVLDQPTVAQAQKLSRVPLSRPKMAEGIFKVRDRADVDKEEMLMSQLSPDGYGKQPDKEYDEEGAKRQGPESRDLKLKMMAEGGRIDQEYGSGPEEDNESSLMPGDGDDMEKSPAKDEYMASHFAEGGSIHREMDEQPKEEYDMEHEDSIAAAIMAKKERQSRLMSDSDDDKMVMMAEGGYLNGEDSIYSDDSDQADLRRNAEEDKNLEDQASYDAMRKENYSESEGLSQLDSPMDSNEHSDEIDSDDHDMISQIRSKMNRQRQFKVR